MVNQNEFNWFLRIERVARVLSTNQQNISISHLLRNRFVPIFMLDNNKRCGINRIKRWLNVEYYVIEVLRSGLTSNGFENSGYFFFVLLSNEEAIKNIYILTHSHDLSVGINVNNFFGLHANHVTKAQMHIIYDLIKTEFTFNWSNWTIWHQFDCSKRLKLLFV